MRTPTATLLCEAKNTIDGVDHLLANTTYESQLSAKDCYDIAEKLERARNLMLVVGDRKYQQELNQKITDTEIF